MMTFSDELVPGLGMAEPPRAEAAISCHKARRMTEVGPEIIKIHFSSCLPPVFLLCEKITPSLFKPVGIQFSIICSQMAFQQMHGTTHSAGHRPHHGHSIEALLWQK